MNVSSYNQAANRKFEALHTETEPLQVRRRPVMRTRGGSTKDLARVAAATALGTGLVAALAAEPTKPAGDPTVQFGASVALKETYDGNVFLQSATSLANRASFSTSVEPRLSLTWRNDANFGASLSYSSGIVFYHDEPGEDHQTHRAALSFWGNSDSTEWNVTSNLVLIDGSSVGPTWSGPGGAPAAGGIAVRDRRDAAVYRARLQLTQFADEWFLRPTASFYLHDFLTEHRATPGYQNYVDRNEVLGGVDVGRRLGQRNSVWLGYRCGAQGEAKLLAYPEVYDSSFHRILLGGKVYPVSWLQAEVNLGPEVHRYGDEVPISFGDRDEVYLFVDASVKASFGTAGDFALSIKRFEQPGFGGRSVYDDLTYDLSWRRRIDKQWEIGTGFRAYNTDFHKPVVRNDWIVSAQGFVNCSVSPRLSIEASYVFEQGLTADANAGGREYSRHLVAAGIKYIFQ